MEAIDNKTTAANAANNKATKAAMRRILKARAEKCGAVGWTTGQQHITSKANNLADALSRNDYGAFITNAADRGIPRERLRRLALEPQTHDELETLLDVD